ncbi:hypothetical protein MKW92_047674, partial [Papaver armeniacum]
MMSQSYDVGPEGEPLAQLPQVEWVVHMYINEELTLDVPRPTSYAYNFDHITVGR